VLLGADADKNAANAKATIALFDTNLKLLNSGDAERGVPPPPTTEIRDQLSLVGKHWSELNSKLEQGLADAAKFKTLLPDVQVSSVTLLDEMNKCVSMYEAACKAAGFSSSGTVVNLAGRQRMLSQKMAKEVCFIALGVDADGQRDALQKSHDLFKRTLKGLVDGDAELGLPVLDSDSIKRQLGKVDDLWKTYAPLVEKCIADSAAATGLVPEVAEINTQVLTEMNKAVTMFEGTPSS
jgi:hypothetical protein